MLFALPANEATTAAVKAANAKPSINSIIQGKRYHGYWQYYR
jgi:hypothetical protein